jgi:hypothetical protein
MADAGGDHLNMVRMLEYEYVFIGKFYEMSAKKRRNGSE